MDADAVISAILNGDLDDERDRIVAAIRQRDTIERATAKAIARSTIRPGQRVRMVNISPKYLTGIEGTVQPRHLWKGQRIAIDIGNAAPRFGTVVQAAPSTLEVIS